MNQIDFYAAILERVLTSKSLQKKREKKKQKLIQCKQDGYRANVKTKTENWRQNKKRNEKSSILFKFKSIKLYSLLDIPLVLLFSCTGSFAFSASTSISFLLSTAM